MQASSAGRAANRKLAPNGTATLAGARPEGHIYRKDARKGATFSASDSFQR